MKTFHELGTMPKVGDLIMRRCDHHPDVYLVTKIIGDTYHVSKSGFLLHEDHLRCYYTPLSQETQ